MIRSCANNVFIFHCIPFCTLSFHFKVISYIYVERHARKCMSLFYSLICFYHLWLVSFLICSNINILLQPLYSKCKMNLVTYYQHSVPQFISIYQIECFYIIPEAQMLSAIIFPSFPVIGFQVTASLTEYLPVLKPLCSSKMIFFFDFLVSY
jgi:hypothetical protein